MGAERLMPVDLTAQTFGRLRVVERLPRVQGQKATWRCACACGQATDVRVDHLLSGHTTSCGCAMLARARDRRPWSRRNLRGQRIGHLFVLRVGPNVPAAGLPAGATTWIARCDCGREVQVKTSDLTRRSRPLTDCGCRHLKPAAPATNGTATAAPLPAPAPEPIVVPERTTTSQQALDRFHDAQSPLGRTRRVTWPVEDDDAPVIHDFDPYA